METAELARMFLWVLGPSSLVLGIANWSREKYWPAVYRVTMGIAMLGAATYGAWT